MDEKAINAAQALMKSSQAQFQEALDREFEAGTGLGWARAQIVSSVRYGRNGIHVTYLTV